MKKKRVGVPPARKKNKSDTFTVSKKETLLAALLSHLPHKKRNLLKAVLKDRQVSVDGIPVTQFNQSLVPGQSVEVRWDRSTPQQQSHGLPIIFEDEDLIIIDKPPGLLTFATDKEKSRTAYAFLTNYLKAENPDNKIFLIHRLDRETSGLLMFAKNETSKGKIQETWNDDISQRTYFAVVAGNVQPPEGTITSQLTESKALRVYSSQNQQVGRKAVTNYKKIRGNDEFSLLQVNLETGIKHQIRVHMQDLGHPIIGDSKYGSSLDPIRRIGLHAQVLVFTHPKTGKPCRFETPLPKKFLKLFPTPKAV